jgi:hypothetical protein
MKERSVNEAVDDTVSVDTVAYYTNTRSRSINPMPARNGGPCRH